MEKGWISEIEFEKLNLLERAAVLWVLGKVISHEETDKAITRVYAVSGFYAAEVISLPHIAITQVNIVKKAFPQLIEFNKFSLN